MTHEHNAHCGTHAYAVGYLSQAITDYLDYQGTKDQLRADLAQTARCLMHGGATGDDLAAKAIGLPMFGPNSVGDYAQ